MVLSKEHTGTSFLDTKDDDIFKAQPLEKEPKEKVKVQDDKVQNIGQKKAQYDKNIWYVVSSKWIYDNQYRIVANSNGFYLNISTRKEFVKIKDLKPGEFSQVIFGSENRIMMAGEQSFMLCRIRTITSVL